MSAALATAPATCKHGHPRTVENTTRVRHTSGRYYDACRPCRTEAVRRVKARQRGEEIPLRAPTPKPKVVPQFATEEVWKGLPKSLRDRVAPYLIDDRPADPLVAAVISRAARKRAWIGLGVAFSSIVFIEALIEECRSSRSQRLRIDLVLDRLLG